MAATIYDVAKLAEVSAGTVSRVINNNPAVRPATRRAVLAAVAELHYQPNHVARTLRTSKTRSLGLVLSDLRTSPATTSYVWGAEMVAQEHGYALIVADSRLDPDVEEWNIRNLLARRVDGLICNPVVSSKSIYNAVKSSHVPCVIYGWTVANRMLPTVVLDETYAIKDAVAHLIDVGHRRIGVVLRDTPRGTGGPIRRQLIHDQLRAHGIEPDGSLDLIAASPEECALRIGDLLRQENRPTALIVVPTSFIPLTVIAVRDLGLRIPDDLSLICFGDSDWLRAISPPINVIRLEAATHIETASKLLIGLIENTPNLPRMIKQRASYIRRDSVQPPTALSV